LGGAGQTVGGLRLDQDAASNYLQVLNKVNNGRLPCWPDQSCPNAHTGSQALSSLNVVGAEDRYQAYQQITQWIGEGALDN
jgi:hypothetical protein